MSGEFYSLGLTGYPLGHSLSPRLHSAALRAMGLAGEYRLYPVEPGLGQAAGLQALCTRLRQGELHGLNVTVPHKAALLPLMDDLTPRTRAIGAANTIFCRAGRLVGDNTDAPGFLADLERVFPPLFSTGAADAPPQDAWPGANVDRRRALVLGAGGSARAVIYALVTTGWWVFIAARRWEQATRLARSLPGTLRMAPVTLDAGSLSSCGDMLLLVVNTTPVGMHPDEDATPWPAGVSLPPAAYYDLVYAPFETRLLQQARAAGFPAANGLGMLIEQAALSLELWTARPVPRDPLWAAAL